MNYSSNQYGRELLAELERGYDIVHLSRWSYAKFISECRHLGPGLREKMMQVISMEEGAEFEMKESEIREFAEALIAKK